MHHGPERIVMITGASGGIGAEVARHLAGPDTHVVVHYHGSPGGADAVADAIRSAGGHASTLGADISDEAEAAALMDSVETSFGRLHALVLNKAVPKGYVAVAASKRAGETALYGMRTVLAHAGVHLTVVSGDRIDGPTMRPLPTADEFAEAIVGATRAPLPPSIVYVGKADYLMSA